MYSNPATRAVFRLLAPLAFGCIVYLLVLLAFDTHSRILEDFFNQELLVCVAISYVVLEANRLLALSQLRTGRRFWLLSGFKLLLALLLTSLITSAGLILYFRYQLGIYNILSFYTELKVFNSVFLFIALLYQSYFLGFVWLHYQYQQQLAAEEEQKKALDQQVHQFSYAIHPDFLFAGLETVILKLREGETDQADRGITLLAELYHYFLRRQEELVPLEEELAAVDTLYQLLLHGGKHLQISRQLDDPGQLVVPSSLVRLLEAIAQSQLASAAAPLLLELVQEEGHIQVRFTPNFSLTHRQRLEDGLRSLHQQYAWLTGSPVLWTEGTPYQVSIPTSTLKLHESHHH